MLSFIALFLVQELLAQTYYPDASLRLHPVWSRVADALGEAGSVESAEFSRDGKYIVSGTKFDNTVIMWRTSDGAELWRQSTNAEVERVGWSADGKWVASCSEDKVVQIWDAKTGELIKALPHTQGIDGLAWSREGNILVTGEEEIKGKEEGWLRFYEMPEGKLIHKINVGKTTNEIMFTRDNQYLLAAGHGFVNVYRTSDMEQVQSLEAEDFFKFVTADFSPDGKYIAAGGFEGRIYLWEWESGKLIRKFNYRARKVESLSWHPNGDYLVTSGHGPYLNIFRTARLLNSKEKEIPAAAQVFASDGAEYIDFNDDGSFMVSAHQDGVIRLWVFMGEDPELNAKRHKWVKKQQEKQN